MRRMWLARSMSLVLACLLALVGCGGDDEAAAPENGVSISSSSDTQVEIVSSEPSSAALPVEMNVVMKESPRRRLMVLGEVNLPDQTRLRVRLVRDVSNVSWRVMTTVAAGAFEAGPLGPSSGLVAGAYTLHVSMPPADVQPQEVKAVIGEKGRFLEGPYVENSPHGLGRIVKYATTYEVLR